MTDGAALAERPMEWAAGEALPVAIAEGALAPVVTVTSRIGEVEQVWRQFEATGVDSPAQSYAFIQLWTEAQDIAPAEQLYVVGSVGGAAIALLPLRRRNIGGVSVLGWFPGTHVGCNAPLADTRRLARLSSAERRALWRQMLAPLKGADLVYLPAVPVCEVDGVDIFAELGAAIEADTLYRASFGSWEEANTTQRSKSRRKHDRQQGERLDALGAVAFEEIGPGTAAGAVLEEMFRQRALRFRQMGVADPFACGVRRFYDASVAPGSKLPVTLHVLRLEGRVVAVRYNIALGGRMFCLISSMSDDPAIQAGSPGKQCLLRVMQLVFETGTTVFDMGAGFTDEKRHWCNVQVPLRHHYMALTRRGAAAGAVHRNWQVLRRRIKSSTALMRLAKALRKAMPGKVAAAPPASD